MPGERWTGVSTGEGSGCHPLTLTLTINEREISRYATMQTAAVTLYWEATGQVLPGNAVDGGSPHAAATVKPELPGAEIRSIDPLTLTCAAGAGSVKDGAGRPLPRPGLGRPQALGERRKARIGLGRCPRIVREPAPFLPNQPKDGGGSS